MKRSKRIVSLVLCAALLLGLAPAARAGEKVRVTLPRFTVTLGGQVIDPAKEEYPFLVYKDITYLPLTYFGCRLLGLYENWTPEYGLFISDAGAKGEYESTPRKSSNSGALYAQLATGQIRIQNKDVTKEVDNAKEEYPFLLFRDITYLPMTWANMHDLLGCEYSFDGKRGLVIDRAQSTNGTALYLPIYRDAYGEAGAIAAWEGWFWFQDGDGWVSRVPMTGGEREKLFELPVNDYMPDGARARPSLTVREDGLFMTYHLGGATMGRDWQYLFHADGTYELLTDFCGAFGRFDGFSLLANCNLSPTPNNLLRSSDSFETSENFGDEHYIYGWSYCQSRSSGGASGRRGTGDIIYQAGNYAYLLGTDVSDWGTAQPDSEPPERFSTVCRVDLTSGKTEPVTGPAAQFRLIDGMIWYIDFDGALHRCTLDGTGDWKVTMPVSTEAHVEDPAVRYFCVDGETVYLAMVQTVHGQGGAGTEPRDFYYWTIYTVQAGSEEEPTWLGGSTELNAFQLDGGYLTAITGEEQIWGNTLTVYKNGKKLYELTGPVILAAGVSGGKLYYVLK